MRPSKFTPPATAFAMDAFDAVGESVEVFDEVDQEWWPGTVVGSKGPHRVEVRFDREVEADLVDLRDATARLARDRNIILDVDADEGPGDEELAREDEEELARYELELRQQQEWLEASRKHDRARMERMAAKPRQEEDHAPSGRRLTRAERVADDNPFGCAELRGMLHSAEDLRPVDMREGACDAMVKVSYAEPPADVANNDSLLFRCKSHVHSTHAVPDSLSPRWDEDEGGAAAFAWPVPPPESGSWRDAGDSEVVFQVFDTAGGARKEFIGQATVPLSELLPTLGAAGEVLSTEVVLHGRGAASSPRGRLRVSLQLVLPADAVEAGYPPARGRRAAQPRPVTAGAGKRTGRDSAPSARQQRWMGGAGASRAATARAATAQERRRAEAAQSARGGRAAGTGKQPRRALLRGEGIPPGEGRSSSAQNRARRQRAIERENVELRRRREHKRKDAPPLHMPRTAPGGRMSEEPADRQRARLRGGRKAPAPFHAMQTRRREATAVARENERLAKRLADVQPAKSTAVFYAAQPQLARPQSWSSARRRLGQRESFEAVRSERPLDDALARAVREEAKTREGTGVGAAERRRRVREWERGEEAKQRVDELRGQLVELRSDARAVRSAVSRAEERARRDGAMLRELEMLEAREEARRSKVRAGGSSVASEGSGYGQGATHASSGGARSDLWLAMEGGGGAMVAGVGVAGAGEEGKQAASPAREGDGNDSQAASLRAKVDQLADEQRRVEAKHAKMRKDTAAFESRRAAAESALDELTKRLQRAATHRRVRLKASTARHGESAKEGEEEGEESAVVAMMSQVQELRGETEAEKSRLDRLKRELERAGREVQEEETQEAAREAKEELDAGLAERDALAARASEAETGDVEQGARDEVRQLRRAVALVERQIATQGAVRRDKRQESALAEERLGNTLAQEDRATGFARE